MKRTILAAAISSVALCTAAPVDAQATATVVGKWAIEYESGRRMENGEVTTITGKGTLRITQSGDSLLATLETGPRRDGSPQPPSTMSGRVTPEGAVFIQKQRVTLNMDGDAQIREITATWTLQANGDVLTGTMARALPGMAEGPPPSPVKGTRVAQE
jgi:hypothetical protein